MQRLLFVSFTLAVLLPLFCSSSLHAAPVALWVSDPVLPGQTVLVFGDGFTGCKSVHVERLPDSPGARDLRADVPVLQAGPKSVKFLLPSSMPDGVFRATVRSDFGSVSALIDRPQVLWAQGDYGSNATPGGFVRIVGKCLCNPDKQIRVRLTGRDGVHTLAPTLAQQFTAQARIPQSLLPGTYQLTVSSGSGGVAAFSAPIPFSVVPARPQAPAVVDVALPESDAVTDTASLQSALDRAGAHGGTVRLPAGRWMLSDGLSIPKNVSLQGAGMDRTALCWQDSEMPPHALITGKDHFAVRDLSMYAINYVHGIVADQDLPTSGFVAIERVRMRLDPFRGHLSTDEVNARFLQAQKNSTGGGDSLRLGGEDVVVEGCDIYGAGRCLYLSRASGADIHDNTLYNGRWGWYCLSGNNGVIFENNSITGGDLMSTGGGLNCLDGATVSQNVYYAGNTLKNMFGWDREAMTTDAGGAAYYGTVASATGTKVEFATDVDWKRDWTGAGVFVLGGAGQGQYRQIVHTDGRDVTVDKPWQIPLDSSSVITVTMVQRNYIFVNNSFADAGVAIQMYGSSIGNIAYGNTSARTAGFHNFGMNYDGVQPSWYVQWLDNRITDGTVFMGGHDQTAAIDEAHIAVQALNPRETLRAPVTLCGIIRGSVLDDSAHLEVGTGCSGDYPYTDEVIVEQNTVKNAAVGLIIASQAEGVLARSNTFVNCARDVSDVSAQSAAIEAVRKKLFAQPGPLLAFDFHSLSPSLRLSDSTGHGFEAIGTGEMQVQDGPHGASLVLDGKGYLTVVHPQLLNMESFTIGLWVKPDGIDGREGLVSKRVGNSGAPFVLAQSGGALDFEATDTRGDWSYNTMANSVFEPGIWHYVVVVVKEGSGVTLYADGKAVAQTNIAVPVAGNDEPMCIGREAWGGGLTGQPAGTLSPSFFHGSISNLVIWPRALSQADIVRASLATK
jgi:hypothetical protein